MNPDHQRAKLPGNMGLVALLCLAAMACRATSTVLDLTNQHNTGQATEAIRLTASMAIATPIVAPTIELTKTAEVVVATVPVTEAVISVTPCTVDLCNYPGVQFLRRPIDPPGNEVVDPTYRFGSTQSGLRDPHHGVEFLNRMGTPVFAAADGKVVTAGTDFEPTSARGVWPINFFGPYSNFYGNLVVIEHTAPEAVKHAFPDMPLPIYTLYGHLSEIEVQTGQEVKAGQEIGKVGMAGIATGSHLHFEVRLGENNYKASRNPELWLAPHKETNGEARGVLAGRFLNSYNTSLELPSITLQHLVGEADGPSDLEISLKTYEEKGLLNQAPFFESFGVGDLPAGWWRITFPLNGLRKELVQVLPGQVTVVTFRWK